MKNKNEIPNVYASFLELVFWFDFGAILAPSREPKPDQIGLRMAPKSMNKK